MKIEYECNKSLNDNEDEIDSAILSEDEREMEQFLSSQIPVIPLDQNKLHKQTKLEIKGITVYFPHKPYENQIAYMTKVIEACQKRTLAALESPTGTGKTLCLLCSVLAFVRHKQLEINSKRTNGSFYINNNGDINNNKETTVPIIYYSSRTHSQLSGAINELKKTCYLPRTAVLSARERMCTNKHVNMNKSLALNTKCRQLRNKKLCKYFNNVDRVNVNSFDRCDIEELYECGIKGNFCTYYFSRNKQNHADIVFLPYNYIIEQSINSKLSLNISNSIIIIDEGHNIESVCEDSVSCELSTKLLNEVISDLRGVETFLSEIKSSSNDNSLVMGINDKSIFNAINIIQGLRDSLKKVEIKKGKVWPEIGLKITPKEMFDILYEGFQRKLIHKTQNKNEDNFNLHDHLTFMTLIERIIVEELLRGSVIQEYIGVMSIILLLYENYTSCSLTKETNITNTYCNNYKFFVNDITSTEDKNNNITYRSLFLYCFNPGFGFKLVLDQQPASIILTSGTLSPIKGIESELKCSFKIQLENTHVINKEQVCFCLLNNSFYDEYLHFRFDVQNRENVEMLEKLGYIIVDVCKRVPKGILVFFPSFTFMNNCITQWVNLEILDDIKKYKEVFCDLHDAIKNQHVLKQYTNVNKQKNSNGAILFSVCRGSASEGIDFSDDYARMVIVVGIPYPNFVDVKVQLKMEYLEEQRRRFLPYSTMNKDDKQYLNGNDWYTQCASRTVNQALGRVIRHINDYGAMMLIDCRFKGMIKDGLISKWLRDDVVSYNDSSILSDIEQFFKVMSSFNVASRSIKKQIIDEFKMSNNSNKRKENVIGFVTADKINVNNNNNLYHKRKEKKEENYDKMIKDLLDNKSKNEINSLLKKYNVVIKDKSQSKKEDNDTNVSKKIECPICFNNNEDNENGDSISKDGYYFSSAKCGHILCNVCWNKILHVKPECPICKQPIKQSNLIRLYL